MLFLENKINNTVFSNVVSNFLHEDSALRTPISMFDIKIDLHSLQTRAPLIQIK